MGRDAAIHPTLLPRITASPAYSAGLRGTVGKDATPRCARRIGQKLPSAADRFRAAQFHSTAIRSLMNADSSEVFLASPHRRVSARRIAVFA